MALNRTRRAAVKTELQVCEQRISGLIESFNFMASLCERSGELDEGQMIREEGLAKAQAMLDLVQGLHRKMQARATVRNP